MKPISLATTVYNEADRILGLLEHAATFCDDIVVVDQDSTDGTADLARDFGAKVIHDEHHGHAEPSRRLMVQNTSCPWVLVLDADEIIYPDRVDDLVTLPKNVIAARLGRDTFVDGKLVSVGLDHQLRYFRRDVVDLSPALHSYIVVSYDARSQGDVLDTDTAWIFHDKTGEEQASDLARYASLGQVLASA